MTITVESKQAEAEKELEVITLAPFYPHIEVEVKSKKVFDRIKQEYMNTYTKGNRTFIKVFDFKAIPFLNDDGTTNKEEIQAVFRVNITNAIRLKTGKIDRNFKYIDNYILSDGVKHIDVRSFEIKDYNRDFIKQNTVELMKGEVAKPIIFEGIEYKGYYVTNFGRILRRKDMFYTSDVSVRTRHILKDGKEYPYYYVSLPYKRDGKRQKHFLIHRLVAYHFRREQLEELRKKYPKFDLSRFQVDHIQNIYSQSDNHVSNLQWLLCSENIQLGHIRKKLATGEDVEQFWNDLRVY